MEQLFTVNEVASRFRYTTETVWKKCRDHEAGDPNGWPHLRDGRTIRFTREHVEAISEAMTPNQAKRRGPKRKRQSLAA